MSARRALAASAALRPGTRCVVRYAEDPGWHHERIFLAAVDDGHWMIYTPDNHLYDEYVADYERMTVLTGLTRYPRGIPQLVSFSRPLEEDEMRELLVRGRAEAALLAGVGVDDIDMRGSVDWKGRVLTVPAPTAVGAPQVGRRLAGKQAPLPLEAGPAGTATPMSLDAADGYGWFISDLGGTGSRAFGSEVRLSPGSVRCGSLGVFKDPLGGEFAVEMVKYGDVPTWKDLKAGHARSVFGLPGPAPPTHEAALPSGGEGTAPPAVAAAAEDPAFEDLRTCWVDVDEAGVRYKEWRKVVLESTQESFRDGTLRGPPTCLSVCRKMQQHGGNPRLWFAEWTKETGVTRKDRAWHEVNVLIDALYLAGTYDQVNVGALASLEVITRRLLQYVEAYAHGAENPNWSSAKHFSGTASALDLVPEEMRTYASRLSKEEAELESLRARAKAPGAASGAAGAPAAAAAALAGGLPGGGGDEGGGGRGRGDKKGGRGKGARPPQT